LVDSTDRAVSAMSVQEKDAPEPTMLMKALGGKDAAAVIEDRATRQGSVLQDLIAEADRAMYRAKARFASPRKKAGQGFGPALRGNKEQVCPAPMGRWWLMASTTALSMAITLAKLTGATGSVLWLIAVILVIVGIVTIMRGGLLLGIVLIILGLAVGPGGWSIWH
jgi:hypothetical protein